MNKKINVFIFFVFLFFYGCNHSEINKNAVDQHVDVCPKDSTNSTVQDTLRISDIKVEQKQIEPKTKIRLDTGLIISFLDQMIKMRYSGKGLVCTKPLDISPELFDCSAPEIIDGKQTIQSLYHGLLCSIFSADEIENLKNQAELIKKYNMSSFKRLDKYTIINCDTLTANNVINQFSIPLFTKDKKQALIICTDEINKSASCTKRIDIYKKDILGNWSLSENVYEENSD